MNALGLLVADGRFPAGGHAHSGGIEAAVEDGRVATTADLAGFLSGRLATAGRVAAAFAAAACGGVHPLDELDREATARIASPALRVASRAQGSQLLRGAAAVLAGPVARGDLTHSVAIGVVARAAGLSPLEAARWAAQDSIASPATAAIRLLGLDPFAVWRAVADLAVAVDEIAAESAGLVGAPPRALPASAAPLLDIGAERHRRQEVRLFAS